MATGAEVWTWIIAPSRERPLVYWRVLVGAFLAVHFGAMSTAAMSARDPMQLLDRSLLNQALPETRVSVLQLPVLHECPWMVWAVALVAAIGIVIGRSVRMWALLALAVCISTARSLYPLIGPFDQLATHLSLWCALVFRASPHAAEKSAPGISRWAALSCLGATLLFWADLGYADAESACVWFACLGTVALMAMAVCSPKQAVVLPFDGSMMVGAIILALLIARPMGSLVGAGRKVSAIDSVLRDLGVDCPAPKDGNAPHSGIHAKLAGGRELSLDDLWPQLPRPGRVWTYAARAPAARGEQTLDRLRLQGSLRMTLARRACELRAVDEVVELVSSGKTVFRFRCESSGVRLLAAPSVDAARLGADLTPDQRSRIQARKREFERRFAMEVPTSAELSEYLADSYALAASPPVHELVRVAQIHYALREFEEAARLVETAYEQAPPAVRQAAGLQNLRNIVLAAAR